MGKRVNQSAVKGAAKKARNDPVLTSIAEVIMEADDLPARCRNMLVDVLPFTLSVPLSDRHEIQTEVVGMVDQTLNTKKCVMEAAIATEEANLSNLNSSRVGLTTAVSDAESAMATQKEAVQAAKCALAEASSSSNASRNTLSSLSEEQKAGDDKLQKAQEEKVALEAAFNEHFKALQEDAAGAGPHFKELEPFLKKLDMEESLLIALPSTCAKAKEHRGTFDNVVMEELEKSIHLKISKLGELVAAETPASVERQSGVQAAEKECEARKETQRQAVAEFEAAKKEESDRAATLSTAKQALDQSQPQVDLIIAAIEKAKMSLESFETGPLAGFKSFNTAAPQEAATAGA